jgi:uracil-DNA glycosylase
MTVMLIGEFWNQDEAQSGVPFTGPSGKLLRAMMHQEGIDFKECYLTTVFRQQAKDLKSLCGNKLNGIVGWPAITQGKYIRNEFLPDLQRLIAEVDNVKPSLIIGFGAAPSWALLHTRGIRSIRGSPQYYNSPAHGLIKFFPTYSPSAVLRDYSIRPIMLADLEKARRETAYPEIRRPRREIWVEPNLDDLRIFEEKYILPSNDLSVDIETAGDQITMIGFAPSKHVALVVPFVDFEKPSGNYWKTSSDELKAWAWVRRILELKKKVVGQNFLYDTKFLWGKYGLPPLHFTDDTMLLHHALQPEMEKGLAFLGSIYTDEASWKFNRHNATIKRED